MAYYATAAQVLERKDWRDIGDLVSDDGDQVSEAGLATDAKLTAAIADASGDIETALFAGGRYDASDLEGLTGNAASHLVRITTEITMYHLLCRRPRANSEMLEYYAKLRETYLDPLRQGQNVFNIEEKIEAGRASVDGPTTQEYNDLNLVRDRVRNYYPGRRLPDNR